ncbi:MAG: hypothetical protein M3137_05440, partial [Actinomycetota bacterium]|nr:hypothetical protein [Actinomycetota bacterium]
GPGRRLRVEPLTVGHSASQGELGEMLGRDPTAVTSSFPRARPPSSRLDDPVAGRPTQCLAALRRDHLQLGR